MKTRLKSTLAGLSLALILSIAADAQAETVWQTRYRSLGGQVLDSTVVLDDSGRFGTYETFDAFGNSLGGGTLQNVQYQNLGGQPLLRGNWSWNGGGSGNFTWRLNPTLDRFQGSYSAYSGGGGFWQGAYQDGFGAVGGGGPVKQ